MGSLYLIYSGRMNKCSAGRRRRLERIRFPAQLAVGRARNPMKNKGIIEKGFFKKGVKSEVFRKVKKYISLPAAAPADCRPAVAAAD